jgi:20S proteasome alpha/beta subunit
VVLGVEKKLPSKLMEASKSEKLVEVHNTFFDLFF